MVSVDIKNVNTLVIQDDHLSELTLMSYQWLSFTPKSMSFRFLTDVDNCQTNYKKSRNFDW